MLPHQDLVIKKHLLHSSQKITVTPVTKLGQATMHNSACGHP